MPHPFSLCSPKPSPKATHNPLHRSLAEQSIPSSATAVVATQLRPRLLAPKPSYATLSSALTKERHRDQAFCAPWSTTRSYAANKGLALSPDCESLSSSSSSSSFCHFLKIHRWGTSCFGCRGPRHSAAFASASPKALSPDPHCESWDPGVPVPCKDWMLKRSSSPPAAVYPVEKPLRESEPVPTQPAPAVTMIARPISTSDDAIGTVGLRKDWESIRPMWDDREKEEKEEEEEGEKKGGNQKEVYRLRRCL